MTEQEKAAADTALTLDLDEAVRKRVAKALGDLSAFTKTQQEALMVEMFFSSPEFCMAVRHIVDAAIRERERDRFQHYQNTWIATKTW